jgi:nucleoid-associated protein YgaU
MSDAQANAPIKAYLSLIPPNSSGGAELGRVTFAYNPKEFSYTKSAQWQRKPAKGAKAASPPEFQGPAPMSLTLEVFLDGYETGEDVSADIDTLNSCCCPMDNSIQAKQPSPPWVVFGWGAKVHLTAIVKSVAVKITMFDADGTPLRATCTLTMEEVVPDSFSQNPTSGGLRSVRSHLLVEGDSLATVAYREYGNAGWWRALAEANGIDDPLKVQVGTRLLVPDIDETLSRAI